MSHTSRHTTACLQCHPHITRTPHPVAQTPSPTTTTPPTLITLAPLHPYASPTCITHPSHPCHPHPSPTHPSPTSPTHPNPSSTHITPSPSPSPIPHPNIHINRLPVHRHSECLPIVHSWGQSVARGRGKGTEHEAQEKVLWDKHRSTVTVKQFWKPQSFQRHRIRTLSAWIRHLCD